MPKLVALGQTVWASVGSPKNLGTLGHAPLSLDRVWPSRNTLPQV